MSAICVICKEDLDLRSWVVDKLGNAIHADCYRLKVERVKQAEENVLNETLRKWMFTQQKSKAS